MGRPEKKEHSAKCYFKDKNKSTCTNSRADCICGADSYNQAIDDMDMWFDSLPLLPSKDKVLHGLRKAKE